MERAEKEYPVSLLEVFRAKKNVYRFLKPTPLNYYANLSRIIGAQVYVKHENHHPGGSFKIRGGVNLMRHLSDGGVKGVVTFSTGNHGLSVAEAARFFDARAVIVVPRGNNPAKNQAIKNTGAQLIEEGVNFEEASRVAEKMAGEKNLYLVHPADEPHLINGVGTEFLEIIDDLPDVDTVILPLGAGSEVAAGVVVLKSVNPNIEVIAVQAKASQAAYLSWKGQKIISSANQTFAGGLATGSAFKLPFSLYKDKLDDFVLLSEDEIKQGIVFSLKHTRNLTEAAGAASIMAALKIKDKLKDKKVVLQNSGCNIAENTLKEAVGLIQV